MTAPVPALVAAGPAPTALVPADLPAADLAHEGDGLRFTPVPLRARHDGWTPDRQRRFIDALAEKGSVGLAAAAVGMDERGAYRLRRRADAASFAAAWDAALAHVNDRLLATAYERAFAGRVKPHLYRGEVVFEEVIHSERLLIWLLTHGAGAAGGGRRAAEAMVVEAERADAAAQATAAAGEEDEDVDVDEDEDAARYSVWWDEDEGEYRTNFPPAPGSADWQSQEDPFSEDYARALSIGEEALECARRRADNAGRLAEAEAARRAWFGLDAEDGGTAEEPEAAPGGPALDAARGALLAAITARAAANATPPPPGLCDLPLDPPGGAGNADPDRALSGGFAASSRGLEHGDTGMGLFQSIKNAIFGHHDQAAAPAAGAAPHPAAAPAAAPQAAQPAPAQPVDVEAVLTQKAAAYGKPNNWRTSIVDLLTLLGLDSSLSARKELANELNIHVGADGSAEENIALHKAVMQELAKNGGKVPDALLHA